MPKYNKLVRDRIPEIIEASGKTCVTEILSDEEYLKMIDVKLDEELAEYHKDQNIEELADLTEAIHAAVIARGYTLEDLERVRAEKAAKRGGFQNKILLKEVRDGNCNKTTTRPGQWDLEEAVALFDLYFQESGNVPVEKIDYLSQIYNIRAEYLGIQRNCKFRNSTGIKMQLMCIDYIVTNGERGLSNASRLFYKTYELYKNAPEQFKSILQKFYRRYSV